MTGTTRVPPAEITGLQTFASLRHAPLATRSADDVVSPV